MVQTKRSKLLLYPYFAVLGFGFAGTYGPLTDSSLSIIDIYYRGLETSMADSGISRCYVGYGPSSIRKEDILVSTAYRIRD